MHYFKKVNSSLFFNIHDRYNKFDIIDILKLIIYCLNKTFLKVNSLFFFIS